ncbi:hypothetical protein C8R43DRAFT_1139485 [Mycena crocata]|nr:hypothetical protein C8R43DRAFT_1139485 [Mycena crocata]
MHALSSTSVNHNPYEPVPLPSSAGGYKHVPIAILERLTQIKAIPYLNQIAGVSILILERVQKVKSNGDQCNLMIEKIDKILYSVVKMCFTNPDMLQEGLLESLAKLTETLQKVDAFMRTQQATNKFKRFLRHQEHSMQLEDCKNCLQQAIDTFALHVVASQSSPLAEIKAGSVEQHQEILSLLAEIPVDSISIADSNETHSLLSRITYSSSTLSLDLLPSPPQIFHGRDRELKDVVDILLQDSTRVALLGPGGIGKTSLARTTLHNEKIVAKFAYRYFVSCESAITPGDLKAAMALTFGLELSGDVSNTIVTFLLKRSSCLLILDNFETPWEPTQTRNQVEAFLALLADIQQVSLLITMRGLERPLNVRWTRPFFPPLQPLSDIAARSVFSDIADITDDPDMSELLSLTGNLPLVVTLIASEASVEGCAETLSRWTSEDTAMLSDGYTKESNLELSLRVSLSSPRMKAAPEALHLLSLLSVLPDGASDAVLIYGSSYFLQHKSTLLRTSLAYNGTDGRLKCLPPVREFVKKAHGPTAVMARTIRLYWNAPLQIWTEYKIPPGSMLTDFIREVGNITSLLEWEFRNTTASADLEDIANWIFRLNQFSGQVLAISNPLRDIFATIARQLNNSKLLGLVTKWRFEGDFGAPIVASEAPALISEALELFETTKDRGRFQNQVGMYYFRLSDYEKATLHWQAGEELASRANDQLGWHLSIFLLALCKNTTGNYEEALLLANEAQRIAGIAGSFRMEINAIEQQLSASIELGYFIRGLGLCENIKHLALAASLANTTDKLSLIDLEAELYLCQTKYPESKSLHNQIVQMSSVSKGEPFHANSLATILSIDIQLGVIDSESQVLEILNKSRNIFTSRGFYRGLPMCDRILADFLVSVGRKSDARELYQRCAHTPGASASIKAACFGALGDVRLGLGDMQSTTRWAVTFCAFAQGTGSRLWLSWAFRILADLFLAQAEPDTAYALFEVALDAFTRMDVHRGKAECFIGLADIFEGAGKTTEAKEMFNEVQKMFEKSGITGNKFEQ